MNTIDVIIDKNLRYIYEALDHVLFVDKLEDHEGERMTLYEAQKIADYLVVEGLITRDEERCDISRFGIQVSEIGGWIEYQKLQLESASTKEKSDSFKNELEIENLKLQNRILEYENDITEKKKKIDNLTIKNLKLQNKQMRNYVLFSLISIIIGAVLSNLFGIFG